MTVLIAAVAFIVALGPLIIFHELGHFLVARCFGVRVLRFSIGFGRPLFTFQRDKRKTQWVIAAFPLGGYVQMLDEREIDSAKYEESDLRAAFNRQPLHKRAAIIVAGPLANFLVAIVLYWLIGLHGIFEPRPILAAPAAATLAQKAGVRAGDEVKAVDREPIRTMVDLRARILKLAIDHQSANLLLSDQTGASRDVILDLSELQTRISRMTFCLGSASSWTIPHRFSKRLIRIARQRMPDCCLAIGFWRWTVNPAFAGAILWLRYRPRRARPFLLISEGRVRCCVARSPRL